MDENDLAQFISDDLWENHPTITNLDDVDFQCTPLDKSDNRITVLVDDERYTILVTREG